MTESLPLAANRFVFFLGLAFVVSAAAARALAPLALRIGLVDPPGGRKQHAGSIPITGGIAMYVGFSMAVLASGLVTGHTLSLVVALGLLVAGGAADDMRDISHRSKFMLQLVAALLMTSWAGVQVARLGDMLALGPISLYHWAIPFSVVCAIGLVNAINMLDGVDGAAAGVAIVATLWLAGGAWAQGLGVQCAMLLLLAAAIAGFLVWNLRLPGRSQAVLFMGDAGSMMLGLALCWFSIDLTQGDGRTLPPIVCVWVVAVPLLDMARVMFVRLLRRGSLLDADREHFHHFLLARGFSVAATAWILIATSTAMGAIGIGAWRLDLPDWAMFYAFMVLLGTILGVAWSREHKAGVENRAHR